MPQFYLKPHPQHASPRVSVGVRARIASQNVLQIEYAVSGEVSQLVVPEPTPPAFRDELWCHTCFELFVGHDDRAGYTELNFAPSGAYGSYQFDSYRSNMQVADDLPQPHILRTLSGAHLTVAVWLDAGCFAPLATARFTFTAVLEARNGTKSYWALAHAPGPPDFHNPACFVATLPAPDAA